MNRSERVILFGVIAAAVAAGLAGWAGAKGSATEILVGILLMAAAMQVRVPPRSAGVLGLGLAIAVATPIYFIQDDQTDLACTLAVTGLGTAFGLVIAALRSRRVSAPSLIYQMAGMAAYIVVFHLVLPLQFVQTIDADWRVMIPLAVAAGVWLLIARLAGHFDSKRVHSTDPYQRDFVDDVKVFVSLVATGGLAAIAYDSLSFWAIGIAGLPFLFAQTAFGRSLRIRRTYRQTIRALARIPEVAGLGIDGHADRTAQLATEVGYDLGMKVKELEQLEFTALMHDIGRITLTEPAILRVGYTDDDIARWGAEIISEAPSLSQVAELVRKLHEPYRKPGEQSDPSIPVISKVVRAASSYDHLVVDRNLSPLQAVEVLHQGAAYDFDPTVIASLRRVLERRLAFHPVQA